jgi:hypothetical protein
MDDGNGTTGCCDTGMLELRKDNLFTFKGCVYDGIEDE